MMELVIDIFLEFCLWVVIILICENRNKRIEDRKHKTRNRKQKNGK
jgi:hypothetical protein